MKKKSILKNQKKNEKNDSEINIKKKKTINKKKRILQIK